MVSRPETVWKTREIIEFPMAPCSVFISREYREKGGRKYKQKPGHKRVTCAPQQFGPCTVGNEEPLDNCK